MKLYPLLTEPIYKKKVWGGRSLERLGRALPGDESVGIGESWEVADLPMTAPGGGGGGPARSVVENGAHAGRTLSELIGEDPAAMLGAGAEVDAFPLLVKFLDARENLSVQVHPSVDYAASHPDVHLKSEAWYVVDAEPDAVLYVGVPAKTDRRAVERALEAGTLPELLSTVPAMPGSCHYLPSGTCHALGAGVVVAEVQTPSDTTFRLHDWDREGRELHVDAALASMDVGPLDASGYEPGHVVDAPEGRTRALVRCEHFAIDEWTLSPGVTRSVQVAGAEVWLAIRGSFSVGSPVAAFDDVRVPEGRTVVLPAALGDVAVAAAADCLLLRVRAG